MEKREGAVVFDGVPVTLLGPEIKSGQKAPDFETLDINRQKVTLADGAGTIRLFSSVPDLEKPLCNLQTQRLEQEARQFSNVSMYTNSTENLDDFQVLQTLKALSNEEGTATTGNWHVKEHYYKPQKQSSTNPITHL